MKFTEEQIGIIKKRNCELLVSAAAGSGKTAVLVERIIQRIIDKKDPLAIDNILVVTFTKAAANEMKQRVRDALEKAVIENPADPYLSSQLLLMNQAKITTIHSFCLSVIRDHFDLLNIDPAFRVVDESENILIRNEALEQVIEDFYQEGDDDFLQLVESYAYGKRDTELEDMVIRVRNFAYSTPNPNKWLEQHLYEGETNFDLMNEGLKEILDTALAYVAKLCERLCELINAPEGPLIYQPVLDLYLDWINEVRCQREIANHYQVFSAPPKYKLSSSKKNMDLELRAEAKGLIDEIRNVLDKKLNDILSYEYEAEMTLLRFPSGALQGLYRLIIAFDQAFSEIKNKKRLIDFTDIEHMALSLLVDFDSENAAYVPTQVAYNYEFMEIMIDEYQDSNMVQEVILRAVSKEKDGQPNLFLVGDVKQSIYRFRMAKPELFISKYKTYTHEGSYQKVHMTKNFRSRMEVIQSVNELFTTLMTEDFGSIAYDTFARLNLGFEYQSVKGAYQTELIMLDKTLYEETSSGVLQATAIVNTINRLMNEQLIIYDKTKDCYRPVEYKDMVILHRAPKGSLEAYINVFKTANIPLYTEQSTGYLKAVEVNTVMSLLRVIDNPDQDIPLATVLKSPIVGLTNEELALVRSLSIECSLYQGVQLYITSDLFLESLASKLSEFIDRVDKWRSMSKYLRIDQLLSEVFDETQYLLYVRLMPGGRKRKKNVELLLNRAISYEQTSYQGIFNFIRYMSYIEKYDIELGEASMVSEHDQVVRLMTIHKSKGLEYPVVFLAGIDKQFNMMDVNEGLVLHQELGVGVDWIDLGKRYRTSTIKKDIIRYLLKKEALEEELRVLYVAMTRAREKLYLVGCAKDIGKATIKWQQSMDHAFSRLGAMCYQDWIMPCLMEAKSSVKVHMNYDLKELSFKPPKDLEETSESEEKIPVEDILTWQYPYYNATISKTSMSVTEMKKQNQAAIIDRQFQPYRPKFMPQEDSKLSGATIGSAYHLVLSHMELDMKPSIEALELFANGLVDKGILESEERMAVDLSKIVALMNHPIWQEVIDAESVYRETPFVMGIEAERILGHKGHLDDLIMVQGVIDLFYVKDNRAVIIDYKSDQIGTGEGYKLINRYKNQLNLYQEAVNKVMGYDVEGSYIFALEQGILIDINDTVK